MQHWDTTIIGGGAAALSAGLVLARTGIAVLIIDDRTPRNAPAAHMHGFLSRDGYAPTDLLADGRDEIIRYGGKILAARAERIAVVSEPVAGSGIPDGTDTSVQAREAGFCVTLTDGNEVTTDTVLVATGLHDELPAISGIRDLWGTYVHHCPHCHGREVAGQRIAVIAGAQLPMSLHQAALLRRYSDQVTFYTNGHTVPSAELAQLRAINVQIAESPVHQVSHTTAVNLALADGSTDIHDAVFVAPNMVPRDDVLSALTVERIPDLPWISAGPTGRTSVPGLWVAGNLANPRAQVVTAAGEGSSAAMDITAHLLARDLARATAGDPVRWYSSN